MNMEKNYPYSFLLALLGLIFTTASCELAEQLNPESDSEKNVRIFTKGGNWNVDTLNVKTDLFGGGISTITSDTSYLNYGTIEFQDPEATLNPGYGAGYMIHRYMKNSDSHVDTLAWVPYNFNSVGQEGVITIFISEPGKDKVVGAFDMYLDLNIREDKKVRFSGWRRETIYGGSGGSYGLYRSYSLSR
jgi:hypothetical protein